MDPEKTSFFQAFHIPTKTSRGTVEILKEVHLIKEGDKVGASESVLLKMMNIKPFAHEDPTLRPRRSNPSPSSRLTTAALHSPAVLDVTTEDLRNPFLEGVRNIAAISLAIERPTLASAPHSIANGFKNLMTVAAETLFLAKFIEIFH